MEGKTKQRPRKRTKKGQKSLSKLIFVILIFIIVVIGIIFLGKYLNKRMEQNELLKDIHEDVSLNSKEKTYYDLLLKAMYEHEELVSGVEHVYFNLFELPGLEHEEKENIAKKVLHSFEIHKDKELLIDTFDGLYFTGILDMETSELKDGIYVTFEDLDVDSKELNKQFAISIYKTSDLNPKMVYDVTLDKDNKIVNYKLVSNLMPHEDVEKPVDETEEFKDEDIQESVEI